MVNGAILLVLALLIGGACAHMLRQKKRGARCVGCPCAGTCKRCAHPE